MGTVQRIAYCDSLGKLHQWRKSGSKLVSGKRIQQWQCKICGRTTTSDKYRGEH